MWFRFRNLFRNRTWYHSFRFPRQLFFIFCLYPPHSALFFSIHCFGCFSFFFVAFIFICHLFFPPKINIFCYFLKISDLVSFETTLLLIQNTGLIFSETTCITVSDTQSIAQYVNLSFNPSLKIRSCKIVAEFSFTSSNQPNYSLREEENVACGSIPLRKLVIPS